MGSLDQKIAAANRMVLQEEEWIDVAFDGRFSTSYLLINHSILILQGNGYSNLKAEKQSVSFGNAILDQHLPPGKKYILIQDWRNYGNSSSRARQYFIDSVVKDTRLKGLIFCNTTWAQSMTIKLARTLKILKVPFHLCTSLEDAIAHGEGLLSGSSPGLESPKNRSWARIFFPWRKKKQAHEAHIQDLLDYLETIDWKTGKFIREYAVNHKHPMLPVFDAISFIKSQLDMTFQERNQIEHQLVQHKDNLEAIIQKRTQALKDSQRHFKQLLEHSPVSIAVVQDDYELSFVNQKFTNTFGWALGEVTTPDQFVPLVFKDLKNQKKLFIEWADAILASTSPDKQFGPNERQVLCKDGSIRTVEFTATGIGDKILVVMNDITKRKIAEAKLEELTIRDELTSLYNRRHFIATLDLEFDRFKRYAIPLSMMFIDVDHFKQVNDTHGHPVGDKVLRALAGIAAKTLREIDTVFRIGGEEFAVIMPETPLAEAMSAGERLRTAVETTEFNLGEIPLRITVSIGVSMISGADITPDLFMTQVDNALYTAKNMGRNRVEYGYRV